VFGWVKLVLNDEKENLNGAFRNRFFLLRLTELNQVAASMISLLKTYMSVFSCSWVKNT
jgi:hypothetical protein